MCNLTFNWESPASEEYTTVFDAIVYDAYQSCQGNIIGLTPGAELPPSYDAMSLDQIASLPFFPLSVDDSDPGAPVLEMVTPPAKFDPSFFDENTAACSNANGSSSGGDGYVYYCGTVRVCITLQAHICGFFLDFVDVALQFSLSGSLLPPNSSPSNTEEQQMSPAPIVDPGCNNLFCQIVDAITGFFSFIINGIRDFLQPLFDKFR